METDMYNKELMAEIYLIGLLERVQTELQECRVFVTTKERMYPVGIELYDNLQDEVSRAVQAYRDGKWHIYVMNETD